MTHETENSRAEKSWFTKWSIGLGVVGSIAIGVATNFLTDFIKDIYTNYSVSATSEHISNLEAKLEAFTKSNDSVIFYISYLFGKFFDGIVNLFFSIAFAVIILMLTCAGIMKLKSRQQAYYDDDNFLKYWSYGLIVLNVLFAVLGATFMLSANQKFLECYLFSRGMMDYNKTINSLKAEISEFKAKNI